MDINYNDFLKDFVDSLQKITYFYDTNSKSEITAKTFINTYSIEIENEVRKHFNSKYYDSGIFKSNCDFDTDVFKFIFGNSFFVILDSKSIRLKNIENEYQTVFEILKISDEFRNYFYKAQYLKA